MSESSILSLFQSDSLPLSKFKILPNGNLHFLAPIARVTTPNEKGLPYYDSKGSKYYQKVNLDVLTKSIDSFKGISICLNHPNEKVRTSPNKRALTRGLTSTGKTFNSDTHIWMCGTNFDEELIKSILEKRTPQISLAYDIELKPTDQKDVFDQIKRDGDHLAFVPKGRNGDTVALNLDKEDSEDNCLFTYFSEYNTDSTDYLQLLRSELDRLPESIINLEEVYLPELINLDTNLVTKKLEGGTRMKSFSIVDNKGSVITYQADTEEVSDYIQHLRSETEKATVALSNQDSVSKNLESLESKITDLESQITELTTQNEQLKNLSNQDSSEEINKKAGAIALGMFEILPSILQLDSSYEIGSVPKSQTELMRDYLILVNPARKDELSGMNFDSSSPEGIRNTALIEGMYLVTKDLASSRKQKLEQKDSGITEMDALQRLLRGTLVQDSAPKTEDKMKERSKVIDSNF